MDCTKMNTLLDAMLDGGLPESMRAEMDAHAASCPDCARKLMANRYIIESLKYLPEECDVPLGAAAAWRNAVRQAAQKRRHRKATRIAGIAAALVLAVGAISLLQMGAFTRQPERQVVYVAMESDGLTDEEAAMLSEESAPAYAGTISSEDAAATAQLLSDLVSEYGGTIDAAKSGGGMHCFIKIPGGNARDFIAAAAAVGSGYDLPEVEETESEVSLVIDIK